MELSEQQVIPLSTAMSAYRMVEDEWFTDILAPCYKMAVYDVKNNICVVWVSLGLIDPYVNEELCPSPKPWHDPNHKGLVKAIHVTYE